MVFTAWFSCSCSSTEPAHGCDTSGASSEAEPLEYAPCAPELRVGGFGVQITAAAADATGSAQLSGSVRDRVSARDVWDTIAEDGECRVVIRESPFCNPPCTSDQECSRDTGCVPVPVAVDVGTVTVTGLKVPVSANILPNATYYTSIGAYPPFEAGDRVTLTASGAGSCGFALHAAGIEPIAVPTTHFAITPGEPLTLTWTRPNASAPSRIGLSLDIAHHGNIAARLLCDVPDTGSHTITSALLTALIDRGVAGFPVVNFIRRTVDSTTTASGCIEFAVASAQERALTLPGLTSCNCPPNVSCDQCPEGQLCQVDFTCR